MTFTNSLNYIKSLMGRDYENDKSIPKVLKLNFFF